MANCEDICLQSASTDLTVDNFTNRDLEENSYLESLNLSNNPYVTNEGLKNLVNLKILNLNNNVNQITDEGLEYVKYLEELCLRNNHKITDIGLSSLKRLKILNM